MAGFTLFYHPAYETEAVTKPEAIASSSGEYPGLARVICAKLEKRGVDANCSKL